jgi:crossover junction endodeoxyribonuclease RuvC
VFAFAPARVHHGGVRILGIDPGLNVTGYGLIEVAGDRAVHVRHGVIRTRPAEARPARLLALREGVLAVARESGAAAAAIESGFVGQNVRSALLLGEARAAAILALADAGLEVAEYAPAMVKQTVAGFGRGEKEQVARMVAFQLGLPKPPSPEDAADALAVAITHWAHGRLAGLPRR